MVAAIASAATAESEATVVPTCSYQRGGRCHHQRSCGSGCCCANSRRGDESFHRVDTDDSNNNNNNEDDNSDEGNVRSNEISRDDDDDDDTAKTSAWTAYLHLVKGTVGPGCLSLPWAVSQLGIGTGCLAIGIVAVWTSYNCWTVVRLVHHWNDSNHNHSSNHHNHSSSSSRRRRPNGELNSVDSTMDTNESAEQCRVPHHRRDRRRRHQYHRAVEDETAVGAPITYPKLSNWLCGPLFERYTLVCICLQQLAICTVFLSFVTTNLQAIFISSQSWTPSSTTTTTGDNETTAYTASNATASGDTSTTTTATIEHSHYTLILSLVALVCGSMVCALPNLKALAPLTTYGTGLLLTGLCLLGAVVILVVSSDSEFSTHAATATDPSTALPPVPPPEEWYSTMTTIPLALCALLYSFEGICLVLPVQASMRQPQHFHVTFGAAMVTATVLFCGVAAACVMAFGPVTQGSITAFVLLRYSDNAIIASPLQPLIQLLIRLANAAVSVSVLLTYPLQLFPCLELWTSSSSAPSTMTPVPTVDTRRRTTPSARYLLDTATTAAPYSTESTSFTGTTTAGTTLHRVTSEQRELELLSLMRHHHHHHQGLDDPASVPTLNHENHGSSPMPSIDAIRETALFEFRHRGPPVIESSSHTHWRSQFSESSCNGDDGLDMAHIDADGATVAATVPQPPLAVRTSNGSAESSSLHVKITLVAITYMAALAIPHVETLIAVAGAVAGSSTALLIPPALQLAYERHHRRSAEHASSSRTTSTVGLSYILLCGGFMFLVIGSTASIRDIMRIYANR